MIIDTNYKPAVNSSFNPKIKKSLLNDMVNSVRLKGI
jgi:hypothetical protein